jgi:hypothetical protein
MTSRRPLRIALAVVVLSLLGWMFVAVIWLPLYREQAAADFVDQWNEPALEAEIIREDATGTRAWSLKDQQALSKLRQGLRSVHPVQETPPQADRKFRVQIRRADSRVDEYEVLLDENSSERDMLYVVRRSGGATVYGSVYNTPEIRSTLKELIREK